MARQLLIALLSILLYTQSLVGQDRQIQKIDGGIVSSVQLDKAIKRLCDTAYVTGLAISILNNKKVVYQKAFGYANRIAKDTLSPDIIFYGASLSKAVFSVL